MSADAKEAAFQQDIIDQMIAGGWQLGDPALARCFFEIFNGLDTEPIPKLTRLLWVEPRKLHEVDEALWDLGRQLLEDR